MRIRALGGGFGLLLVAGAAAAQQTQVDLTSYFNDSVTTYCCSSAAYPTSGLLTNLGVTFSMASVPTNGAPLDVWRGEYATNRMFTLAIGMTGISKLYTLMNTRFGNPGDPSDPTTAQAALTFNYTTGASVTEYLFGCYNIRDHNPNGYSAGCWPENSPAPVGSNAQQWGDFGSGGSDVVFDMQTWNVDPNRKLASVTFQDANTGINTAFLRGVTLDGTTTSTPEPSTWVLVGTGFAGLAGLARRKRS